MKTYAATLYVTLAQRIEVQAETPEEARAEMLDRFNLSTANYDGETDIDNFQEVEE